MSLFTPFPLPCPACGVEVRFQRVTSVNGGRKPDQRQEILDRTFQEGTCEACGTSFRMSPDFVYFDLTRDQWLTVQPAGLIDEWQEGETKAFDAYDKTFGTRAIQSVRDVGRKLRPRLVYGWEALREKLLVDELGYSDTALEIAKLLLLREWPDFADVDGCFRLTHATDDELYFTWMDLKTEEGGDTIIVPRQLLDFDPHSRKWADLTKELELGYFVDTQRLVRAA